MTKDCYPVLSTLPFDTPDHVIAQAGGGVAP